MSGRKMTKQQHQGMFSSITSERATPDKLFRELHREFAFEYDLCPMDGEAIHRDLLPFSPREQKKWPLAPTRIWMNPPYGKNLGDWLERALAESRRGSLIVALIPSRTDTSWWHDYVMKAQEIRFLRGRLRFIGPKVGRAPFPSAIVVFRAPSPESPAESSSKPGP